MAQLKNPPAGCTVAQNLCGGAPPGGLTHGPTSIDIDGNASAQGPYRVQWVVIDSTTAANSAPRAPRRESRRK